MSFVHGIQPRIVPSNVQNPQPHDVPGGVNAPPVDAVASEKIRGFKTLHNLHLNPETNRKFVRLQPDQKAMEERLGREVGKSVEFSSDERGILVAKLKLREGKKIDGQNGEETAPLTAKDAKANYKTVKNQYVAFKEALVEAEDENKAGFGEEVAEQNRRQQREYEAKLPFMKKFFSKVQRVFGGEGAQPPNIALKGESRKDGDKSTVKLTISSNESAADVGVDIPRVNRGRVESHSTRNRWLVGYAALGLLGGAAIAAAALVTAPAWVPFVGVALVAGAVVLTGKAALGKAPWWGNTINGRVQYEERQAARQIAGNIAGMVKKQVLKDYTEHDLAPPEGGYFKRYVLNDPKMVTGFIQAARNQNVEQLRKLVRDWALNPDQSPLTSETIDKAKEKAKLLTPSTWAWGERAHAKKTLETLVDSVTQGIMQGVCEGVLETVVGELSDEKTTTAQESLHDVMAPRIKEFTDAAQGLSPTMASDKVKKDEILDPGRVGKLRALKQKSCSELIEKLGNLKETIGEKNVEIFSDVLRNLDEDLTTHIDSLTDISALVKGRQPGAADDAQSAPTIASVNRKMLALISDAARTGVAGGDDDPSLDVSALGTRCAELKKDLEVLEARIQNPEDPDAKNLVKAHADALIELIGEVRAAVEGVEQFASAVVGARSAFARPHSMQDVNSWSDAISKTMELPDIDPARLKEGDAPLLALATEALRLRDLCETLKKAVQPCLDLKRLQEETLKLSEDSLAKALSRENQDRFETLLRTQRSHLDPWIAAGHAVPADLGAFPDTAVQDWKNQAVAKFLNISQEALEGNRQAIEKLADPAQENTLRLLKDSADFENLNKRLSVLSDGLRQSSIPDSKIQTVALRVLTGLKEAGMSSEDAKSVACAMHPGASEFLGAYVSLESVDANLKAFDKSPEGQKLRRALNPDLSELPGHAGAVLERLLQFYRGVRSDLQQGGDVTRIDEFLGSAERVVSRLPQAGGTLSDWAAANPEAVLFLQRNDLGVVAQMASAFASDYEDRETKRAEAKQRYELEELKQIQASEILLGASGSNDAALVSQVRADLKPVQGVSAEEVILKAQQASTAMLERDKAEWSRKTAAVDLINDLKQLRSLIRFKGSDAQMLQGLQNDELRGHLLRLVYANKVLLGESPPPQLKHAFTLEELREGAKELAGYAPRSQFDLDKLAPEIQGLVRKRQEMSNLLRKDGDPKKTFEERGIEKALKNSPELYAYVEQYLYEKRALDELDNAATGAEARVDETAQRSRAIRSVLEGSTSLQEQAGHNLHNEKARILGFKDVVFNTAAASLVRKQAAVEEVSLTFSNAGAGNSPYLDGQLEQIEEARQRLQSARGAFEPAAQGSLRDLGQLLHEADLVGESGSLRLAYLKGEYDADRAHLKYLNLDNLKNERPGWFGRVLFRLLGKGERLSSLLRQGAGVSAQDMARSMAEIVKGSSLSASLASEVQTLNEIATELTAAKNALIAKPDSAENAFALIVSEVFTNKEPSSKLTETEFDEILRSWSALVGEEGVQSFPELIPKMKQRFLGKTAQEILSSCDQDKLTEIGDKVNVALARDDEFVKLHKKLKDKLTNSPGVTLPPDVKLLLAAGLDFGDKKLVDDIKSLEASAEGTQAVAPGGVQAILQRWEAANQLLLNDKLGEAVYSAGAAKRYLEDVIKRTPAGVANKYRVLLMAMEGTFLTKLGGAVPSNHKLEDANARVPAQTVADGISALRVNAQKSADIQEIVDEAEAWEKKLEKLEKSVHVIDQLNYDKAPPSLIAFAYLATARRSLGRLYEELVQKPGLDSSTRDKANKKIKAHFYNAGFICQQLRDSRLRWGAIPSLLKRDEADTVFKLLDSRPQSVPGGFTQREAEDLDFEANRALDDAYDEGRDDGQEVQDALKAAMILPAPKTGFAKIASLFSRK